jgi:hypothetical protein
MHGVVSRTGGTEAGVLPKYKKLMLNIIVEDNAEEDINVMMLDVTIMVGKN